MASTAIITLLAYVGRAAELRHTPSGTAVMTFTVATNRTVRSRDGEKTERTTWFRVSLFGSRAEGLAPHVRSGQQVFITGEFWEGDWTDSDGNRKTRLEIEASDIQFAGSSASVTGPARETCAPRHAPAGTSKSAQTDSTETARRTRPSRQFDSGFGAPI